MVRYSVSHIWKKWPVDITRLACSTRQLLRDCYKDAVVVNTLWRKPAHLSNGHNHYYFYSVLILHQVVILIIAFGHRASSKECKHIQSNLQVVNSPNRCKQYTLERMLNPCCACFTPHQYVNSCFTTPRYRQCRSSTTNPLAILKGLWSINMEAPLIPQV